MEQTACKNDHLQVNIRTKQNVRFKAGADLSSKVNRVTVEVNEDSQDEQHITEISIHLFAENCLENQQD